jgi:hypothetical protein
MSAESIAFEKGIEPLMRIVFPEKLDEVLAYRPDEQLQQRIDELASKCNEGELSDPEREEYEGYVRANKFLAILRRQALRLTKSKG